MNDFNLSMITGNEPPIETDTVPRADYDAITAELAKLKHARDLGAQASATLRDESLAHQARILALEAELADWQRMRNEAMAVATSNRERINVLEAALLKVRVLIAAVPHPEDMQDDYMEFHELVSGVDDAIDSALETEGK